MDDKANPVVSKLLGIAERLKAVIIADGHNSIDEAVISYRKYLGSPRVFVVDPEVEVWDTDLDKAISHSASARVAGRIAKTDNDQGFWWSPLQKAMNSIVGTVRPVEFALNDNKSRAYYLNEHEVANHSPRWISDVGQ